MISNELGPTFTTCYYQRNQDALKKKDPPSNTQEVKIPSGVISYSTSSREQIPGPGDIEIITLSDEQANASVVNDIARAQLAPTSPKDDNELSEEEDCVEDLLLGFKEDLQEQTEGSEQQVLQKAEAFKAKFPTLHEAPTFRAFNPTVVLALLLGFDKTHHLGPCLEDNVLAKRILDINQAPKTLEELATLNSDQIQKHIAENFSDLGIIFGDLCPAKLLATCHEVHEQNVMALRIYACILVKMNLVILDELDSFYVVEDLLLGFKDDLQEQTEGNEQQVLEKAQAFKAKFPTLHETPTFSAFNHSVVLALLLGFDQNHHLGASLEDNVLEKRRLENGQAPKTLEDLAALNSDQIQKHIAENFSDLGIIFGDLCPAKLLATCHEVREQNVMALRIYACILVKMNVVILEDLKPV